MQEKPAPFTPGVQPFWDDEHISSQMLAMHLNPEVDAASRPPETIARSVDWIIEMLGLQPGQKLLDLGCGPGLYSYRFAERGLAVTGVDLSRRSIDYARNYVRENGLEISYRCQDYLKLDEQDCYDAAVLIYGDFCPLSPEGRRILLDNIQRALRPQGGFVLDVSTRSHRARTGWENRWQVMDCGFWRPHPHLLLEQGFDYPEKAIFLNQACVIELDGKISIYRMWFQDYDLPTIAAELAEGGFEVVSAWGDLAGAPHVEDGEWIGLVTKSMI